METYRKKQTHKQKLLFTITSRGFMNPVQNLTVNSILLSLHRDHFKGLMLMLQPMFQMFVSSKQNLTCIFLSARFNLKGTLEHETPCISYDRDAGTGQTGQTMVWPGFPNS